MVPLTMPITRSMRSPASDSRSGRMIGMPPATAASNSRSTPARSAAANSSAPWLASSSLLAGDDRLAGLEGGVEDQLAGRLDAADELDDHVDVGVVDDAGGVVGEHALGEGDGPLLGQAAHGDRGDLERRPVRAAMSSAGCDQLDQGGAHVAAPQHPHPDGSSAHRRGAREPSAPTVGHGTGQRRGPAQPTSWRSRSS